MFISFCKSVSSCTSSSNRKKKSNANTYLFGSAAAAHPQGRGEGADGAVATVGPHPGLRVPLQPEGDAHLAQIQPALRQPARARQHTHPRLGVHQLAAPRGGHGQAYIEYFYIILSKVLLSLC